MNNQNEAPIPEMNSHLWEASGERREQLILLAGGQRLASEKLAEVTRLGSIVEPVLFAVYTFFAAHEDVSWREPLWAWASSSLSAFGPGVWNTDPNLIFAALENLSRMADLARNASGVVASDLQVLMTALQTARAGLALEQVMFSPGASRTSFRLRRVIDRLCAEPAFAQLRRFNLIEPAGPEKGWDIYLVFVS